MKHTRPFKTTIPVIQDPEDNLGGVHRRAFFAGLLTCLGGGLAVAAASAAAAPAAVWLRLPVIPDEGTGYRVFAAVVVALLALVAVIATARGLQILQQSLDFFNTQVIRLASERDMSRQKALSEHQKVERRLEQLRAAADASHLAGTAVNAKELMDQLAALLQERFSLAYAGVYMNGAQGGPAWRAAAGHPANGALTGAQPILLQPAAASSELKLPVMFGGRTLGTIILQPVQPKTFDPEDVIVLQGIADSLACALVRLDLINPEQARMKAIQALPGQPGDTLAMENARLLEVMQRRVRQEQLVGEIAARAQSSLDLDMILRSTVQELGLALGGATVQIRLGDDAHDVNRSSGGLE